MIKLIVSDIDGTLVNHKKELPNSFWDVFELMSQKNILFCAASGRQVQSLEKLFAPVSGQIGLVSDNGALVKFQGKELHEQPMRKDEITPILQVCETIKNAAVVLCGKEKAYVKTTNTALFEEIAVHYPSLERVVDFATVNDTVLKISVCDEEGVKSNSYPKLKSFSDVFKVVVSGEKWLDITDKNVNKGEAIQMLQRIWKITPDQTVVFGDQFNDIEMLRNATYSYAMKNAQPEVKAFASFETDYDNNHEGVIRKIYDLIKM